MSSDGDENVPRGWRSVRLGEVASIQLGKMLDAKRQTEGIETPYLRNINVRWNHFQTDDLLRVKLTPDETDRFALRRGDVLVCEGGEPGRAAVWDQDRSGVAYQKALHRVRLPSGIEPRWLVYSLMNDASRPAFARLFTGTTIRHLTRESFSEYQLPLAPSNEQGRVVEALDDHFTRLDAAEAALRQAQVRLKRFRASVLQAALTGRLVPTEADLARREGRSYEPASKLLERVLAERRKRFEASGKRGKYVEPAAPNVASLPELPEGWCWATADQLVSEPLANGRSVPSRTGGFPVLRLTCLGETTVDLTATKGGDWTEPEARSFVVRAGDVLIARGNGSIRLVGRAACVPAVATPVAFPDTLVRLRPAVVPAEWVVLAWNSPFARSRIESTARTTAGIYKVNQEDISLMPVPLAPMAEQERILVRVEETIAALVGFESATEKSIRRTSHLRQAVLALAFEGRLVDPDPSDEPASVLLDRIRAGRAQAASNGSPKPRRAPRRPKTTT